MATMAISLRPAHELERSFCESLSRHNMESYRAARNIPWDQDRFDASWGQFENLVIVCDDEIVGAVRIHPEDAALGLRDLQVLPERQGQGIGASAIEMTKRIATSRGYAQLKLRVFVENPARTLYERSGFRTVAETDGTLHMTLDL